MKVLKSSKKCVGRIVSLALAVILMWYSVGLDVKAAVYLADEYREVVNQTDGFIFTY